MSTSLTTIPLREPGAELRLSREYFGHWILFRDNHQVRILDNYESEHINCAIQAAQNKPLFSPGA